MLLRILETFISIVLVLEMTNCDEKTSSKNNMALAIYEPPKIFTIFQTNAREFTFAGHRVTISQDWEKNGVAAVVWDAALVLAKYLETTDTVSLAGKRVIELGAGQSLRTPLLIEAYVEYNSNCNINFIYNLLPLNYNF